MSGIKLLRSKLGLVWMKCLTTLYRRVIVVARSIDEEPPDIQPRWPVTFAQLGEKDCAAYLQFRPEQSAAEVSARFARGDECFAALHEGRVIHAAWVALGRVYVPYLRRDLLLQAGDIYLYDIHTLPAFRRGGISSARGVYLLRHYRRAGYRRSLGVVAVENKAALRPVELVNYHRIGSFSCLRLGPWQLDRKKDLGIEPMPVLRPPQRKIGKPTERL